MLVVCAPAVADTNDSADPAVQLLGNGPGVTGPADCAIVETAAERLFSRGDQTMPLICSASWHRAAIPPLPAHWLTDSACFKTLRHTAGNGFRRADIERRHVGDHAALETGPQTVLLQVRLAAVQHLLQLLATFVEARACARSRNLCIHAVKLRLAAGDRLAAMPPWPAPAMIAETPCWYGRAGGHLQVPGIPG